MWYVRDVLYAVLYVRVSCFVVRGCGVSRRYIDVCYCDMFSVVNVYLDHLKFYVVCINSRRYVCCSECNVVSNECNVYGNQAYPETLVYGTNICTCTLCLFMLIHIHLNSM